MPGFRLPQSATYRAELKAYLTSDHVSPATSKTIAIVINKNCAGFGNPSAGATNATESGFGWYYVDLSTTDTNTKGSLIIRGTASGVDDVEVSHRVVDALNADFGGVPAVAAGASGGLPLIGLAPLTSIGTDTAGTITLVGLLTPTRAGNLDRIDVAVSTRSSHSAADVWGVTTRTLTAFGFSVTAAVDLSGVASATVAPAWYSAPANPTDYARRDVAPSWWAAPPDVSGLSTFHAATDPVIVGTLPDPAPAGYGGGGGGGVALDAYEKAYLIGRVAVQPDGSWLFYDADDGATPRLMFTRLPDPGGRGVVRDPT